jgi:hypothetical protein
MVLVLKAWALMESVWTQFSSTGVCSEGDGSLGVVY